MGVWSVCVGGEGGGVNQQLLESESESESILNKLNNKKQIPVVPGISFSRLPRG